MSSDAVLDPSTPDLTATIEQGREAVCALAHEQLNRIVRLEGDVCAFAAIDPAAVLAAIHACSGEQRPLAGVLYGAKDIIETRGLPTHYGSGLTGQERPLTDAWCVRSANARGAILAGKTVTTEYAFARPGPTRNPHDLARTPGGSSSGSAAAVAAGFVTFAFGTQTGGSIIRPASYTGIVGFKPTFGLLPMQGVHPASATLDHLGLLARSCRDAALVMSTLLQIPEFVCAPEPPRRLLVPHLDTDVEVTPATRRLLEKLPKVLGGLGLEVEIVQLPVPVEDFLRLQETICYFEAARLFMAAPGYELSVELSDLLEPFLAMPYGQYAAARRRQAEHRRTLTALLQDDAMLVMPAATGIAPAGHNSTGDAALNRFWTMLHFPCLSLPLAKDRGLPLGIQLVAPIGEDTRLLSAGQWLMERVPEIAL